MDSIKTFGDLVHPQCFYELGNLVRWIQLYNEKKKKKKRKILHGSEQIHVYKFSSGTVMLFHKIRNKKPIECNKSQRKYISCSKRPDKNTKKMFSLFSLNMKV